ncbi:NAD(P)-binding protein [Gymnopus androsaceus JB14]|uniref:NAD(P)-binding protein n=1 Tax=Gymnopus androsaceus JB14 TaxID=1447944 RepID=A0A6A4IA70_9AGAR|nr:NAD(P)-binding protein [Gymnopus androsaceus JB14]
MVRSEKCSSLRLYNFGGRPTSESEADVGRKKERHEKSHVTGSNSGSEVHEWQRKNLYWSLVPLELKERQSFLLYSAPRSDGTPSPYSVRALTRDTTSEQAKSLASLGAELFQGRFDDLDSIAAALEGCYGVFANTDTWAVGGQIEIYAAIKMFEQAHRVSQMRHFVWSGLDYSSKLGNYDPKYKAMHLDAKGAVNDFLRSQSSSPSGDSLTWSIVTTGPYIENLTDVLLGPLPERDPNGAVVFAIPVEKRLEDIGWWTRYTFDHRSETSGQELKIATEMMTVDQLGSKDGATIKDTFSGMYRVWDADLVTRDMEWNRRVHPTGYTLESWIRETGFDGTLAPHLRRKIRGIKVFRVALPEKLAVGNRRRCYVYY